jgi:putative restriction endonuclease
MRYDLEEGEGARVWKECLARAASESAATERSSTGSLREDAQRFGAPQLVRPRLGQGAFRIAVTDAYRRACAVTDEHSLPALEAAHIRPYSLDGLHEVRNGLLLRADLHRLFDLGYVTVTPDARLRVSDRLREDFSNGRSYYPLNGKEVSFPTREAEQPDRDFLRWHNQSVFRG